MNNSEYDVRMSQAKTLEEQQKIAMQFVLSTHRRVTNRAKDLGIRPPRHVEEILNDPDLDWEVT